LAVQTVLIIHTVLTMSYNTMNSCLYFKLIKSKKGSSKIAGGPL